MSTTPASRLVEMVSRFEQDLLSEWVQEQHAADTRRPELLADVDLHRDSRELLALLRRALSDGGTEDIETIAWEPLRDYLSELSRSRAEAGFSPSETATFVFSLKRPLFARLAQEYDDDTSGLVEVLWEATALLDRLGLFTIEEHQQGREALINRQQRELIELSTPVVKLWDGVLALPLIGTLDSARTQVVMESLLAADRRDGLDDRDHRHHRRADRRHAGRAAPAEDGRRRAADGRRLHHQRHPPADRADDRPPRRRRSPSVTTKATLADAFAIALDAQRPARSRPAASA